MWKLDNRSIRSRGHGYKDIVLPEHPNADSKGRVALHRAVMENTIGRLLLPDEIVHHKNENPSDNRPDNLELLSWGEHTRLHHETGRDTCEVQCNTCGRVFTREVRLLRYSKVFCSRTCMSKSTKANLAHEKKIREHGNQKYRLEGCRCDICKRDHTEVARKYRQSKRSVA